MAGEDTPVPGGGGYPKTGVSPRTGMGYPQGTPKDGTPIQDRTGIPH